MKRTSTTRRFRLRAPSPAMVVACIALSVALSGAGYAAMTIPRNSVGSAQVRDRSLNGIDLDRRAIAAGAWHEIGTEGEPPFLFGWSNIGGDPNTNTGVFSSAAYMRDRLGFVHLKGVIVPGSQREVFVLPEGFRPALGEAYAAPSDDAVNGHVPGHIYIRGYSNNTVPGYVEAFAHGSSWVSLDGITFRCAPAGQNGCP